MTKAKPKYLIGTSKKRYIEEIGRYNAELLRREAKPENFVYPCTFRVALRINHRLYGSPEGSSENIGEIHFSRPLNLEAGDLIRTYLFKAKYEPMKEIGSVAYVKGGQDRLVPIVGSKLCLPQVLVEKPLDVSESALIIDKINDANGRTLSRDMDIDLIQRWNLMGWMVKRLEDLKGRHVALNAVIDEIKNGRCLE